jgi:hypothetical protein
MAWAYISSSHVFFSKLFIEAAWSASFAVLPALEALSTDEPSASQQHHLGKVRQHVTHLN